METLSQHDIDWRSHWLQQALAADRRLAPVLEGSTTADVCIVGGGYLGLWTAIRLEEHEPARDEAQPRAGLRVDQIAQRQGVADDEHRCQREAV